MFLTIFFLFTLFLFSKNSFFCVNNNILLYYNISFTLVSEIGTNKSTGKKTVSVTNSTSPTYIYTSEGFTNKDGTKLPSISSDTITVEIPNEFDETSLYSNIVTLGKSGDLESIFVVGSGTVDTKGPYFKCNYVLGPFNPSTGSTPILVTGNYIDSLGKNVPLIQNKILTAPIDTNKSTVYTIVDKNNNLLGNVTYNPTLNKYTATSSSDKLNLENMIIIANAGFAHNQFERGNNAEPENYQEVMNSLYPLTTYPFNELIFGEPYPV